MTGPPGYAAPQAWAVRVVVSEASEREEKESKQRRESGGSGRRFGIAPGEYA